MMNTTLIVARSGFMAFIVLLVACHSKHETSTDIRPVRTMVVGTGLHGDNLTYTGEIRARHESDLGFRVAGKLIARPAEVGAYVSAGKVLAQLDPSDARVAVGTTHSVVRHPKAEMAHSPAKEGGYRNHLDRGVI